MSPEEFWASLSLFFPWVAAGTVVLICLVYSPKKSIWMDEVFSLLLLRDPSFPHMLRSLRHGVDGGMPPYYVSGWCWGAIFGRSLLSFRVLSAITVGGAILVCWRALIPRYSVPAVAFGLFVTVLQSPLVFGQATEARFYGMFALAALTMFAALLRLETNSYTKLDLILAVLANAFLVYSHLLGLAYSAAALISLVIWDRRHSLFRFKVYGSLFLGWLTLVPWIPTLVRISDTGKPHSWMPPPWLPNVMDFYSFGSFTFLPAILAALLLLTLTRVRPQEKQPGLALYLGLAFVLVPTVLALKSHFGVVLFNPRYFLPSVFGAGIVIACALDHIGANPRDMSLGISEGWAVVIAALLIYPASYYFGGVSRDDKYEQLSKILAGNTPVIVEDANTFLPLLYLQNERSPVYYYPMDWEEALKSSTLDATVHYKLMRLWKDNGYIGDRIAASNILLCNLNEFMVLDNPDMTWFEDRVKQASAYEIRPGPNLPTQYWPGPTKTWIVTRKIHTKCEPPRSTSN